MGVVRLPPALRGEVWLTELDPTVGREIQKTRPCLVVSPDSMNRHLDTVTVMPMTGGSRPAPFRVATRFGNKDGLLLAEQLRTADRHRLVRKVGRMDPQTLAAALAVLREMFEEDE
jgi:mRNA interferase MazF